MSISVPGVLLEERDAAALSESATLLPRLGAAMRQVLAATPHVYLLAHVEDDVGQAAVTGALEAAGLLGTQPGRIPPHRLLFCSTMEGKVSGVYFCAFGWVQQCWHKILFTRPATVAITACAPGVNCAPTGARPSCGRARPNTT
jgi:hypothetical protein